MALAYNILRAGAGIAVGAVGFIGGAVIQKSKDDKDFQEKSSEIYELGVSKGVNLAKKKAKKVFVDPIIAKIAMVYYIALADGKISKAERRKLDSMVDSITINPEFPEPAINTINSITKNESLTFNDVKLYLEKVDTKTLITFSNDINKVAKASKGISYKEQSAIDEYNDYIFEREDFGSLKLSNKKVNKITDKNILSQPDMDIDKYFDNFVPKADISLAKEEFTLKMRFLDYDFRRKTKLDSKEIALLMFATALQCIRIYVINKLTDIEPANHGKKENFLHKQQEKILNKFKKNPNETSKQYYASLNDIIASRGVPYDANKNQTEQLGLFKGEKKGQGVNHRFATPGHDPFLGLLFGTVNIMTNTITTTQSVSFITQTHHVVYDDNLKNPLIASTPASFIVALKSSIDRSKEDITPLIAAIIKQLIHIATDMYTPVGIQLPGANLFLDRRIVETITKYVSTGDMVKFGASAFIDEFINKIIEVIHGCLLYENNNKLDNDINRVKTKKLILYSNSIATGSNIITEYITGNYANMDFAGLMILIRKAFTDINFIYDVKFEFLKEGLKDL